MNGEDEEINSHNLFQGTIPTFTWTDWQIWYIFILFLQEFNRSLSIPFLPELFTAHYNHIALSIKPAHVLSGYLLLA
jgi:hypothetical protein